MNTWDIVKIFFVLGALLGVLWVALFFVKKYLFPYSKSENELVNIQVLSTKAIMPKKYLSVVKVEDKVLLLGVSEGSINLIEKIDGSITELEGKTDVSEVSPNFWNNLKKYMGNQ